jgi:chemotaxis protein CheX
VSESLKTHLVFSLGGSSPKPPGAPTWRLDSERWPGLIEDAAQEVFGTMLGTLLIRAHDKGPAEGEVTAMVGLAGALVGVFSVRCSLATANLLASKMLGVSAAEAEYAARDALGEVANVVAGSLINKAPGLDEVCFLSTPTVISGHDFVLYSPANSNIFEVAFDFEDSRIWLCFSSVGRS